ncbi:hypothetical protein [Paraburkholderia terrae]
MTEAMPPRGTSRIDRAVAQAEIDYQLELARGASVIASMLSAENVAAAIDETLSGFLGAYGTTDLKPFIQLLDQRLMARNRSDAAATLLAWTPALSAREAQEPSPLSARSATGSARVDPHLR